MSKNAEQKVTKVLSFLAALYPKFELTRPTIRAYTTILGDLSEEALEAAAKDLGSRSTFFPAAAELRQAAFDLQQRIEDVPTAYEAWGEVCRAFAGAGRGLPEFSHELIGDTVKAVGGWRMLGMSTNQTADRARFIEAYKELSQSRKTDERALPEITHYVKRGRVGSGNAVQDAISETAKSLENGDG